MHGLKRLNTEMFQRACKHQFILLPKVDNLVIPYKTLLIIYPVLGRRD